MEPIMRMKQQICSESERLQKVLTSDEGKFSRTVKEDDSSKK